MEEILGSQLKKHAQLYSRKHLTAIWYNALQEGSFDTPSLAFWQPPPNCAIIGYTTEEVLLKFVHLSIRSVPIRQV